jgi:hypothetical protein
MFISAARRVRAACSDVLLVPADPCFAWVFPEHRDAVPRSALVEGAIDVVAQEMQRSDRFPSSVRDTRQTGANLGIWEP